MDSSKEPKQRESYIEKVIKYGRRFGSKMTFRDLMEVNQGGRDVGAETNSRAHRRRRKKAQDKEAVRIIKKKYGLSGKRARDLVKLHGRNAAKGV